MRTKHLDFLGLSLLVAILVIPQPSLADPSCDPDMNSFRSALISIEDDYPSHNGMLIMPEIEDYARRVLPTHIAPQCVKEIERLFPRNLLRTVNGDLSFYTDAEHFKLGFTVATTGEINSVYVKAK